MPRAKPSLNSKRGKKTVPEANALKLRSPTEAVQHAEAEVHVIRKGVRCDTDRRGHETPRGRSILEIVVDASEGFIPLWSKGTTLHWRFRDSSFASFEDPVAAKRRVEALFAEAILAWESAAPVKFAKRSDTWDFEIVMRQADDCDDSGCVLASAFLPDGGRHQLLLYPKMFTQTKKEQLETMVHEIGHIFGLRHFFAQVSERSWPSEVFGKHNKFSIMNYGESSMLTDEDKSDLRNLYQLAWSGELTQINGTPIRFFRPYHATGQPVESMLAVAQLEPVLVPQRKRLPSRKGVIDKSKRGRPDG